MKESSVLHRKIAPASLARMNLSRQKAKSILTILSLSLGGVLAVLISTMLVSYEGLIYSVFATLVTLILGTGFGFLSVQAVVKTMNPYFYYSFPWLVVLIYLVILLIVQFILISYTIGTLKKQSLVEQIRATE